MAALSPRWLPVCNDLLNHYGPVFTHNMGGTLSHFEIRFTAGIAHYYAHGHAVVSAVYLPGVSAAQDSGALEVFTHHVTSSAPVQRLCADPSGFASHLRTHSERPLSIGLVWGNSQVAESDAEALIELGTHLAGAYLCIYTKRGAA